MRLALSTALAAAICCALPAPAHIESTVPRLDAHVAVYLREAYREAISEQHGEVIATYRVGYRDLAALDSQ
ncbi:hypothetical protein MKK75_02925 [Methylobacterium sp. J-030]|uniref:hypothetical protein n=1 Tax=Methylobacterium sp. J-030 TaxID=2836627 RepID=UPI001FBC0D01|nr:hypothetical protein [Methylobacterium sp. J-030]MCJ2067768.1 hypothetical protein [Methylobacterium sp. J-030]